MKNVLYLTVFFLFSVPLLVRAQSVGSDDWLGNASANLGDSNWSGANNPPISGDSWVFDGANTTGTTLNNNLTSYTVNGITFNADASAYTINGNSIALTGSIANNSNNEEILDMEITSGALTNNGTGTGSVNITAPIDASVSGVTQDSSTSTLILSNASNAYTGATTISAGTLQTAVADAISSSSAVAISSGATLDLDGNSQTIGSLSGAGTVTSSDNGVTVTLAAGGSNSTTAFSGTLQDGSGTLILNKQGSGILTLSGDNTYSGGTILTAGTLDLGSSHPIGSGLITFDGGTLQYSVSNTTDYSNQFSTAAAQQYDIDTNGQNVTFANAMTSSGGALTKIGSGTLALSAANTYSGGTTINAGTLEVENANALGTGNVVNNATLSIGTTDLMLSGTYTQNTGSTLDLTINSISSFGKITSSSGSSSLVVSGSTVNVAVAGGYIPNNTTFEVLNTEGAGLAGSTLPSVTTSSPFLDFSSSIVNGNLILTADNTSSGLASFGNSPNARTIGGVMGGMVNPSADMVNVLNTLESQSNAQITAALSTMVPEVDGGVIQNSSEVFNNVVSATLDRIQSAIDHEQSGISSGDEGSNNSLWAKPFGSYLAQSSDQSIKQYNAWNAGAVVGYDDMVSDNITLGVSGAYANGEVNSDLSSATTGINTALGSIYAGYQDFNSDLDFFVDATASVGWNWYDGQRNISVGTINRTADSNYDGQQYGAYVETGYKFYLMDNPIYPNLQLTPLASMQWTHLAIGSYSESGANSLDLNVDGQNYNVLESGLGFSIANPIEFNWGHFTPEAHVKWLHDYEADNMVLTSSLSGGGGSFTSYGIKPSTDGADIGGKLSFDLSNNLSLIADADTELRQGFFGVYGSGTVRYKF